MLELDRLSGHNPAAMQNGKNQRIINTLECIGPSDIQKTLVSMEYYWQGMVKGTYLNNGFTEGAYIEMINPATNLPVVFDRFLSDTNKGFFSFAFDLAGYEIIAWEEDTGVSFIQYFDSSTNEWITMELPTGSYSPSVALDFFGTFTERLVDVTLGYIRDNTMYCRYQRERYSIEHEVPGIVLPANSRIRAGGFTADWRFGWRFYEPIPSLVYRSTTT